MLGAIVLGTLSSLVPFGPVTVLVIRRAMDGDPSGALRMGIGRAPAEGFYCGLATFGIAALLEQSPGARLAMGVLGTGAFAAVGVWLVAQQPRRRAPSTSGDPPADDPSGRRWGDWAGFVVSILNPTLILSWSALVGFVLAMLDFEPAPAQKLAFPLGLGLGIALGYVILIAILRRYGEQVEERFVRVAIRLMGAVFIALALWNARKLLGLA